MINHPTNSVKLRSFIIPVLDFSPHSPYNIKTLLKDLEDVTGEVICVFNSKEVFDEFHKHPRINKYCYNNLNAGVSRSWDLGINLAEGKAMYILNADMHVTRPAIYQMDSHLFSLDNAVIVGPQGSRIDYQTLRDAHYFDKGTFDKPVKVHAVSGFFFAIHAERFHKHNLMFDVQFSPCFFEEWDMGLQVIMAGLSNYAVPVKDFDHKWGASQNEHLSVNYFGKEMSRNEILPKNRDRFVAKWHNVIFNKKSKILDLDQTKTQKIEGFFERIKKETYPEKPLIQHTVLTKKMLEAFFSKYLLPDNCKILDVGCGQGVALEIFKSKGLSSVGITLNNEDFQVCKSKGHVVYEMDQSFLEFNDEEFDFIWCRHCLEHSFSPYFTLIEFFRVLKHKGYLYIEVPAPDTSCGHQTNINHYSVLGKSMWIELIKRSGFDILETGSIPIKIAAGHDIYWAFTIQKA